MQRAATILIWSVSLGCLVVAALLATIFGFMANSIDPGDLIASGIDAVVGPWTEAAVAIGLFLALAASVILALRLWHTQRFKLVAIVLTCVEIAGIAWACLHVYRDYF